MHAPRHLLQSQSAHTHDAQGLSVCITDTAARRLDRSLSLIEASLAARARLPPLLLQETLARISCLPSLEVRYALLCGGAQVAYGQQGATPVQASFLLPPTSTRAGVH